MADSVQRTLLNARKHAKRGELDEARALFRSVLDRFPGNRKAQDGLKALDRPGPAAARPAGPAGPARQDLETLMSLCDAERFADAQALGEELARAFPASVAVRTLLGAAYASDGRMSEALTCYRQAVRLDPQQSAGHNNLGVALARLGRLDEAEKSYERAVEADPGNADAWGNLGVVRMDRRRQDAALEALTEAVRLDPGHFDALAGIAAILSERVQHSRAVTLCQQVLHARPALPEARLILGDVLRGAGRLDEALEQFTQVARQQPGTASHHCKVAQVLVDLGRMDEAEAALRQALQADAASTEALSTLAAIHRFAPGDPLIAGMERVAADPETDARGASDVHFALAKACADAGDPDGAFGHFLSGNAGRKRLSGYDIGSDRALFERIRKAASRTAALSVDPDAARPARRPVFVVGMPRSGTTLAERILSAHSQVYGAGELPQLHHQMEAMDWRASGLTAGQLSGLRSGYLEHIAGFETGAPVVVDKMPLNFRFIGFILHAMPEARIVHMRRDARATCWSIFTQNFDSLGNGYADDLKDVVSFYGLYRDLMAFWDEAFPGRIHHLDYEALTENQEQQTRALLAAVDLDWEDACLDFHTQSGAVRTASRLQVQSRMYTGSSAAWRRYAPYLSEFTSDLSGF